MADFVRVYSWKTLSRIIGPGLLLAGAAVGVSHLVQATRAGAEYGFALWWILLLAIISKYPFLEFGPRFAAATGHHVIHGYHQLGRKYLNIYLLITIGTMVIIQAAVTLVTAGLAEHFFGFGWPVWLWSALILASCVLLLFLGRYPVLDITMKIIISTLTICTLIAVVIAFWGIDNTSIVTAQSGVDYWNAAGIAFIIAFMGWMPIPLDASVWHSIWSLEKARNKKYRPTVKEANVDFNLGYLSAAFIGLLFFLLGALVMFGTERSFPAGAVAFSAELISLYGETLGVWSAPFVAIAAFVTMFSTTLAVCDAYPRVASETFAVISKKNVSESAHWRVYVITLITIPVLALIVLYFLSDQFTLLVDFAAGLSFVAAPILAWFNYKLITSSQVPVADQPGKAYRFFTLACLIFLILFTLLYLVWRLGA